MRSLQTFLKPGGQLLLFEHDASEDAWTAKVQHRRFISAFVALTYIGSSNQPCILVSVRQLQYQQAVGSMAERDWWLVVG